MSDLAALPSGDAAYARQLLTLLPPGPIWPRSVDATLAAVALGLAAAPARLAARAAHLLDEAPAGDLVELLTEWEATLGLPDPCAGDDPSIASRQRSVRSRIAALGGQSVPYFVGLAATLGFDVTIDEYAPSRFGGGFGEPFGGEDWAHAWTVHAPALVVEPFLFGLNRFGEGFSEWGSRILECTLARFAPAHTILLFAYSGARTGAPLGVFVLGRHVLV